MTEKESLTILKIGGSVITEKSKGVFNRAKHQEIERIAREIAKVKNTKDEDLNLILIHGAGSFGHPYVERYDLREKKNIEGIIRTHLACKKLNILFCEQLIRQNLFPYPVHPFSSFRIIDVLEFNPDLFTDAISEGFIPVSHGDMVYNKKRRFFEVLSGDNIVAELAERLRDKFEIRIGMATDTDGVVFEGKVLGEIRDSVLLDSISNSANLSEMESVKSDVTGGMAGKIKSLERVAEFSEITIFNGIKEGNIQSFLKGENIGTRIKLGEVR